MERWERAYANGLLVTWKARTWCSRAAAEFRTACSGTELRIIECRVAIIVEKNHTPPFGGLPKATPYGGGRLLPNFINSYQFARRFFPLDCVAKNVFAPALVATTLSDPSWVACVRAPCQRKKSLTRTALWHSKASGEY